MTSGGLSLLTIALVLELAGAGSGQLQSSPPAAAPPQLTLAVLDGMRRLPGGLAALPTPPVPSANPQTRVKIELGRMLFFDKRLSNDNSIGCSTCHDPAKAYSDGRERAVGIHDTMLARRTPSLLNSVYNSAQFWDGRSKNLEDQALVPMLEKNEMGMAGAERLMARLRAIPEYRAGFRRAFGSGVNLQGLQRSIAAFERTLVTPGSAFDRYAAGDKAALTDPQKRGLILFIGKASCSQCHNGPNFTDNKFHNLGLLPGERENDDLGHFAVTRNAKDRHSFKTPSLRSASQQSHFMHNGFFATLAQVIDFYDQGGGTGSKSDLLFELHLTDAEREDLLVFLQALAAPVRDDAGPRGK